MISPMRTELEDLYLVAINFIRYKKKNIQIPFYQLLLRKTRDNVINSDNVKRAKYGCILSELIQTSYSKQVHLSRTYSQLLFLYTLSCPRNMQLNPGLLNIVGTNNSSLDSLFIQQCPPSITPINTKVWSFLRRRVLLLIKSDAIKLPPSV